jgi:hypothetical protein
MMNEIYLGHTLWEYAFMLLYMCFICLVVYTYVRVNSLKEEVEYYRALQKMREPAFWRN